MNANKKINVKYYFVDTPNNEYGKNLQKMLNAIHKTDEKTATFEKGGNTFLWELNELIGNEGVEFITLAKTREREPIWFNEFGKIDKIPITNGYLGDLFYAFINPLKNYIITFAAGSGSASAVFGNLLNELSLEGGVRLVPLYEDDAYNIAMNWDYYKKISITMDFKTYDELMEFKSTKEGALFEITDVLGGLKSEITISTPRPKQVLNANDVRNITQKLITNDNCCKLLIKGCEFETEKLEEIDLKNAQVKYTENIEMTDSYIKPFEAVLILKKALFAQETILEGGKI